MLILALLVTTLVAGTFCQKITFDNTDAGMITVGRFYIDGTIGEDGTALVQQKWLPIIFSSRELLIPDFLLCVNSMYQELHVLQIKFAYASVSITQTQIMFALW